LTTLPLAELPGRVRALDRGETLFRQGDKATAIFAVDSGRVSLIRHTADDRKAVLHRARAGELFAEAALFSPTYHCDAVADVASRVRVLSKPELLRRFRADPEAAERFMAILARQVMALRTRLELRSIRQARERLVQHLRLAAGTGGIVTLDGTLMDLAAELGMTHETLYRTLAELEGKGVLAREEGAIRLIDFSGL
jgi:CRP-like cAMP-binding protein